MCQCGQDCGMTCSMLAPSSSPVDRCWWLDSTPSETSSSARREVSQIRRRLVLPGRRDVAIIADRVDFLAQRYILIVVRTKVLGPFHVAVAAIVSRHRPWTDERTVDGRDFVMEKVGIALVEKDALLDDRLVVLVQRNAAVVERA